MTIRYDKLTRWTRSIWQRILGRPSATGRKTGTWNHDDLTWMAKLVRKVPGDFAEIGVFQGAAFRRLAVLAHEQTKLAHAFDSFSGMAEPGVHDGTHYPKGKFDIGGTEQFIRLMNEAGVARSYYKVWPGYVPECFVHTPNSLYFSLAILDLDHYEPTVETIRWITPRISAGGILALDDYVESHSILATKAIKEFLASQSEFRILTSFNQQLILQKS